MPKCPCLFYRNTCRLVSGNTFLMASGSQEMRGRKRNKLRNVTHICWIIVWFFKTKTNGITKRKQHHHFSERGIAGMYVKYSDAHKHVYKTVFVCWHETYLVCGTISDMHWGHCISSGITLKRIIKTLNLCLHCQLQLL